MLGLRRFLVRSIRRLVGTERILHALQSRQDLEALSARLRERESAVQSQESAIKSQESAIQGQARELGRLVNAATINTLLHSTAQSYFECVLNGTKVFLPRDTVRTMTHCVHASIDAPFVLAVETRHMNWLQSWLRPGDTFLDVGASTGAMTLPIAMSATRVKVIAFEPRRTAHRALIDTLRINGVGAVEVCDVAVSDTCGTVSFTEVGFDPSGKTPFLPETSSITTSDATPACFADKYEVSVTTLDTFFSQRTDEAAVRAVKIDVEGFETKVVQGGLGFLTRVRPYLAIDIHRDPFGEGTTEAAVRESLSALGYRFENAEHVLLCTPPQ